MTASTNVFCYVLYISRFFSYNTTFNDFVVPTQENKAYSNVLLFQLILNRSILKLQYYLKILIQWSGKFQSTKVRAQNIKQWSRWSLCINLIFYIFGKSKKKNISKSQNFNWFTSKWLNYGVAAILNLSIILLSIEFHHHHHHHQL
jgi:hypothetical protein